MEKKGKPTTIAKPPVPDERNPDSVPVREPYGVDQSVYVVSEGLWTLARVIKVDKLPHPEDAARKVVSYWVHYPNWSTRYDEWVFGDYMMDKNQETDAIAQQDNAEFLKKHRRPSRPRTSAARKNFPGPAGKKQRAVSLMPSYGDVQTGNSRSFSVVAQEAGGSGSGGKLRSSSIKPKGASRSVSMIREPVPGSSKLPPSKLSKSTSERNPGLLKVAVHEGSISGIAAGKRNRDGSIPAAKPVGKGRTSIAKDETEHSRKRQKVATDDFIKHLDEEIAFHKEQIVRHEKAVKKCEETKGKMRS